MVTKLERIGSCLLGLIVLIGLVGCPYHKQHPPFLRNTAEDPAHLVISYDSDSPISKGVLAPKSNAGHADKGLKIASLRAEFEDGLVVELLEPDMALQRANAGYPDPEVWLISRDGIEIGDIETWRNVQSKAQ